MYDLLIAPFAEFQFMRAALAGCLALAFAATPVGLFLLLRRMSLMGDVMSHAVLPGAAIGYLLYGLSLGAMSVGGIVAGLLVALASGFVARSSALREDASLAAFYLLSMAAGVLIISVRGRNVDLLHVLFGNVLALDSTTLCVIAAISTFTLFALALLWRALIAECHDSEFLRRVSRTSALAHYGFLALVTLNLIGSFHALGTLMAVGIMILPSAAARLCCKHLPGMVACSVLFALTGSIAGLLLSFHANLPAGPAIICALGAIYLFALIAAPNGIFGARLRRLFSPHLEH